MFSSNAFAVRRALVDVLAHVNKDLARATKRTPLGFADCFKARVMSNMYSTNMSPKTVTLDNMNQNFKPMEYAVRGPLYIRAAEIENELEMGVKKPFNQVIRANVGDCHAMGQKPITYIRQVLTLCTYPDLMKDDRFPSDVKKRASEMLNGCLGRSVGSYSDSEGLAIVRKHVAEYIERRDGAPANYLDIILGTGANQVIKAVLSLLDYKGGGKVSGIMVPSPQYPVYSATIAEYGMYNISYYLDEDNAWALNIKELKRAINEARKVCFPRGLVVINPGNPTGAVLTRKNIEEIIKFAHEEKLFLMADEVYQDNVYAEGMQFYSFKKVMTEMGEPYKNMELASFMSVSKGYMGECGLRAGYCEIINLDPEVKKLFLKSVSARSCSSILGQAALSCIANPPQKGEPSYDLFMKEKNEVLQSLKDRAILITKALNNIKGIRCNEIAGAMYAFPRVELPEKAVQKAKSLGQAPDFFYVMQLLENTGICVVPGSGFGQIPGTYHFRTTVLPPTDKLKIMLKKLEEFQEKFLEEYK